MRQARRDPAEDRELFRLVRSHRGGLKRAPRQAQPFGEVPREERHARHAEGVDEQRVEKVLSPEHVAGRGLVRRRRQPARMERHAEQRVHPDAEGPGDRGSAQAHEHGADETRQPVKRCRAARRAARDVDDRGPRHLVDRDLPPRERQQIAARAQHDRVDEGRQEADAEGQKDDPQAYWVPLERTPQKQDRGRPEEQDQKTEAKARCPCESLDETVLNVSLADVLGSHTDAELHGEPAIRP